MMPQTTRRVSDLKSLYQERQENAVPWSCSPFAHSSEVVVPQPGEEPEEELLPGELRVKAPEEVPWIDLLLEIAMTTAFASLTDGTPILQYQNALSYVCYFMFVWWIWVAQVAYNMRFRQADVLHRVWVFAQLIIFSALAAFTRDFDITSGIARDDTALVDAISTQAGLEDQNGLVASNFRNNRLPLLNARGLSITMALSRLLLLLQYVVVFYHARHLRRSSLMAHMAPLLFSSLCYFAAFFILGTGDSSSGPSEAVEITKLVLWYLPIIVEIISHFVALSLPGFVRYSTDSIYKRSGTVFLIILGAGLDKITSGFQTIIGNAGLGRNGIQIFVSAAIIFIGFFSLYFGTPGSTRELGHTRALAWFFSQFFFLAALIVALQGIATSLGFSNLNAALLRADSAAQVVYEWMSDNPNTTLSASNFNSTAYLLNNLGISINDFVDDLNGYTAIAKGNVSIIAAGQLFEEMTVFSIILEIFDAQPDQSSLLSAKMEVFLNANITDTTELNMANFQDLYSGIIKDRGSSALWFYPAAGATILALVLMSLIKGLPRDKWEWGVIANRFLVGTGVCLLSILDIGSSKPVFDAEGNPTDSNIWIVAVGTWHLLLIIMASVMATLLIVENVSFI
ncbi:hypothetical protein PILCRDRAFT_250405 [Piloderma croceum F 1598]|uniref:Uncharacterized protein n=1 Tax=Piloderma croceum (strain F 1598) TaxID=765440 RepID=A0A0C3GC33_PILCF|nr:hypothetical protein PILCRDRAFT_250405 [Piloderma croceum F 1598]